jgi:hypothetical protein
MSFVHVCFVGHFDPGDLPSLWTRPTPTPLRPIDEEAARALLASFGEAVERRVGFAGGCACCQWAPAFGAMDRVREYAERLAEQQGAIIYEDHGYVRYPPEAVRPFQEATRAWMEREKDAVESGL